MVIAVNLSTSHLENETDKVVAKAFWDSDWSLNTWSWKSQRAR
jgi:hypothetical protein